MRRPFLRAKIPRARVTGRDLHYEGSITIDSQLLAARLSVTRTVVDGSPGGMVDRKPAAAPAAAPAGTATPAGATSTA